MVDLLDMLDIHARARAVDAITSAIAVSFEQDGMRQTQNEIKDRFNHCRGLIGIMRKDLKWSWQRIEDDLPNALRCKLDKIDWKPNTRTTWVTDGDTGLILPPGAK
jgi:hypothetical protein